MILILFLTQPSCAQIDDPFASTDGNWVSLDDYSNKEPATEEPLVPPSPVQAQNEPDNEISRLQEGGEVKLAVPDRPLNYPVMPSRSLSSGAIVSSTEDEREPILAQQRKWAEVDEVQEENERQEEAKRLLAEKKSDPFGVRFATLPSTRIHSVPDVRVSQPKLDREAKAAKAAALANADSLSKKNKASLSSKNKDTAEACEAYANFRRKQLDALESDRRTLSELRSALAELGMTNKLSFMTEPESSLAEPQVTKTVQSDSMKAE